MKSALLLLALAQAQAVFGTATTSCNADNCARAVTGTRYPSPIQSDHKADCSSFLRTTITPATSTVTVTVTNPPVNHKRDDDGRLVARQATQTPSAVPSYASACSGTARYSSACSCAGVTRATTFAPTPTTTVTATVTATGCPSPKVECKGQCQDLSADSSNCGACGKVCPSGSQCQNGVCSNPGCNGSQCGSLNNCGDNCFCFETANGSGFCGPGTSCAPLADCSVDKDCPNETVCATGTCCGRNVCLGSQGCDSGVGLSERGLFGRQAGSGNWTNGNPSSF